MRFSIQRPEFLLILIVCAIVFGSLYPFSFHASSTGQDAISYLLSTWLTPPPSRGNILANVLFYSPLGFGLSILFKNKPGSRTGWRNLLIASVLAGAVLSALMEVLQYYDAGRESSFADIYLNAIGSGLGAILGRFEGDRFLSLSLTSGAPSRFAALLLVAFIAWRLYPYEPVIDLHKYWHALKPVLVYPSFNGVSTILHASIWASVLYLIRVPLRARHPRLVGPAFVVGVLMAKIVILDQFITMPDLLGVALAVLFDRSGRIIGETNHTRLLAALFLLAVVLERLWPLELRSTPHPFGWVPFASFLHGSIAVNAQSIMQKTFLYGSALVLLSDAGLELILAGGILCAVLFMTSLTQVYLVGRSGEITDTLLALILAQFLERPNRPKKNASWRKPTGSQKAL